HVGTDVENADFERRKLIGIREKGDDLLLLARVQGAGENRAARGLDFLHQRSKLVAIAPADEHREAFCRKFLGDLGADVVARSDHGRCLISRCHEQSPYPKATLATARLVSGPVVAPAGTARAASHNLCFRNLPAVTGSGSIETGG